MVSRLRQRLIDPLFYRLGYLHHSDVIQSVSTWESDQPGAAVSGFMVFPDRPAGIHVEFTGTVYDANDGGEAGCG